MKAQQLIETPRDDLRPHVVLLGAGASRAAFPDGDADGRRLPVMNDLVDLVGLRPLLESAGRAPQAQENFEALYSRLLRDREYSQLARDIERAVDAYFVALKIPDRATHYDRLLLSLRPKDAVFTFNWDPFLFDAYERNRGIVPLPEIFFLHGNVRIGACLVHDAWGARNGHCATCGEQLANVPLLYPVEEKDYSSNRYIRANWHAAELLFEDAFTLTIFGYGAPTSDADAVALLRRAWLSRSGRTLEHVEIIDVAQTACLHDRWSSFTPTLHYRVANAFEKSRLAQWPRRSREALFYPLTQGVPCGAFPLPTTDSLAELQDFAISVAQHERVSKLTFASDS